MSARPPGIIKVALTEIDPKLRPASQMRAHLDKDAIADYALKLSHLPPVKLKYDRSAGHHWVIDGAHTLTAAKSAGLDRFPAIVTNGSYEDAWREAAKENEGHGVRLTTEDRRARVRKASEQFPGLSSRQYAALCNVSHNLVWHVLGKERQLSQSDNSEGPTTVTGKDGKQYRSTKPKQPRGEPFVCHQCGEEFDSPVWHCADCGEHWPDSENVCPNCWNPDEVEPNPSLVAAKSRDPLPGQRDLFADEDDTARGIGPEAKARRETEEVAAKQAETWRKFTSDLAVLVNCFRRLGGFKAFCRKWPPDKIRQHIAHCDATIKTIAEMRDELRALIT